jgi:hypothetical protein
LGLLAQSRGESAAVVVARRGKNASALSFSVRRRAISRRSQPGFWGCSRNRAVNPPPSSSLAEEKRVKPPR